MLLQVIAASDVPAGAEILNTYGELGNAELVIKYGFALLCNPFNSVQLDKQQVVDGALQHAQPRLTERSFRRRKRFLEDERWGLVSLPAPGSAGVGMSSSLSLLL